MSPIEWYYAHGDRQAGPVPPAELKQLADGGELLPDDLVWREGMEQWVAARNVKGLFEGTVTKAAETPSKAVEAFDESIQPVSPMPSTAPDLLAAPGKTALDYPRRRAARHLFDIMLDGVRAQFTPQFVDATTGIFVTGGHYCLYVAMLASFGVALALGIKTESLDPVLRGVLWLLALAVLQYVAGRFCVALDRLNRTTAGNVSTTVFLDSFALLNMAAGLAILLGSAVLAVRSDTYSLILSGLVLFIACEYLAFVSLNPETLSISVAWEARAGEEAIGVLLFLLKGMLRLAPVAFGAGVVCGTLWLLCAGYQVFADGELDAAQDPALMATTWIVCFAALPFVAYVLFLLFYLLIGVIRAVLSLPAKLDVLAENKEEEPEE